MLAPSTLIPRLVVSHAAFALPIFKRTLNPISLALHPAQPRKRYELAYTRHGGDLCIFNCPPKTLLSGFGIQPKKDNEKDKIVREMK